MAITAGGARHSSDSPGWPKPRPRAGRSGPDRGVRDDAAIPAAERADRYIRLAIAHPGDRAPHSLADRYTSLADRYTSLADHYTSLAAPLADRHAPLADRYTLLADRHAPLADP
ncbi:hypothetical protein [Actinomadura sp. 6N118]|uniref:hypothetical protein n=1 Tax=Actinomadura sp. 6N118 TaxID=3375151 RepID=UPI0037B4BE33